ncbi:MAG: hypothetical protein QXR96_02720, partial [Candidatus Woesearchaeota archaeon]
FFIGAQTIGLGGLDFLIEHEAQKGREYAEKLKPVLDTIQLFIGLANIGIAFYSSPIGQAISNSVSPEFTSQMNEFINSIYGHNSAVPLGVGLSNLLASSITIKAKTKVQEIYNSMISKVKEVYEKLRNSELFESSLFGLAGANTYLATNNIVSIVPLAFAYLFEKITDYARLKVVNDNTGSEKIQKARSIIHNLTYPITEGLEIGLGLVYLAAFAWYTPIVGIPIRILANKINPNLQNKIDQFLMPLGGINPMNYLVTALTLFNAARYKPPLIKIGLQSTKPQPQQLLKPQQPPQPQQLLKPQQPPQPQQLPKPQQPPQPQQPQK